jgi:hypothetical protein
MAFRGLGEYWEGVGNELEFGRTLSWCSDGEEDWEGMGTKLELWMALEGRGRCRESVGNEFEVGMVFGGSREY